MPKGSIVRFDPSPTGRIHIANAIEPIVEDQTFLVQAVVSLPREPCDGATWSEWTDKLKAASGRKGRALYHPRRLALTGREAGPELAAFRPLIGRVRALGR